MNLASRTVKSRGEEDEIRRLDYIGALMSMPELSIVEVQKKIAHFGDITSRMSGFTRTMLFSISPEESNQMAQKISKYETITDNIELELTEFLLKISKEEMTTKTSLKIRGFLETCGELERIADIFYQMSKTIERKKSEKLWFNQHQRTELHLLFDLIDRAFVLMNKIISVSPPSQENRQLAKDIEMQINTQRDKMRKESTNNDNQEGFNVYSTLIYTNLFSALERVGDHIENVTEAMGTID